MRPSLHPLLIVAFAAAVLAGCQSTPTQNAAPVEDRAAGTGTTSAGSGATTAGAGGTGVSGTATGGQAGRNPLTDPSSPLSKRSVYFDYDQFVIKDEFRNVVESHAKYLQANRNARVTVQGNTDERGTREYNIALGQKRADALKKLMVLLGAGEAQIETVSFGKEKPRREGHDETSWTENRRDDIVYAGE
jgi:peptidoglycan-associated lipoprotein